MRRLQVLLIVALSVTPGCGQGQIEGKPRAVVEAPSPDKAQGAKEMATPAGQRERVAGGSGATTPSPRTPSPLASAPSAVAAKAPRPPLSRRPPPPEGVERELVLDTRRSSVAFVGSKVTIEHEGSFAAISGEARLDGYAFKSLALTVKMESVSSDHPKLTNHLKSADFFHTAKYPTARFVTTRVRPGGDGAATHTITGELSLLAVTKRITFPATIVVTDAGATGIAEFTINRKDFGIVYPGRPDDLIADDVLLKLNLAYLDKRYAK